MCKSIKELEQKLKDDLAERDETLLICQQKINQLELEIAEKKNLEQRIEMLEYANRASHMRHELLARLLDDQNQYSRKTNLIVDGLNVYKNDKDDRIRRLFLDEIKRLDLDIDPLEVDRAHRTGRSFVDKKGKRHTPVIVRFTSWRARNRFYEARYDSKLYVKADVTTRRQNLLDQALAIHEVDSHVSKFLKFIFVDRNCHLTAKTSDDRYLRFNSMEEFRSLPNYVEDSLPPYAAIELAITNDFKRIIDRDILVNLSGKDIQKWKDEDSNNVYIGRPSGDIDGSLFQNPYSLNDFDRATAISKYKEHIFSKPELMNEVESLRGKKLGCYCYPEDCHGQILIDILHPYITSQK